MQLSILHISLVWLSCMLELMNCIFAANIEYRNLNQKKLSACAKPPYVILPPCIPSPYSVPPYAYPPAILSHPMHALPLFCPTPCMPSPYSIPPMHTLPLFYRTSCIPSLLFYPTSCIPSLLFYPTSCIPSLLFYPSPCIPSPLLYPSPCIPSPYSIPPMHTLPLFYLSSCTPSPCSIPAYTHPPPILIQPMHALSLFYSTHTCPPLILSHLCMSSPVLYQPTHATPVFYSSSCMPFLSHEPGSMFLLWHLRMPLLNLLTLIYHHHLPSLVIWCISLWHLNVCCFHSQEITTLNSSTYKSYCYLHIYHIITTYIVYHYSSVDIAHSIAWLDIHNNKLHTPIIVFFIKCSHYSTGKVDGYECE